MHDIAVTVLGLTGLLFLVSFLPPLANRLNLPYTVLLAVVGCALGGAVIAAKGAQGMGLLGDFLQALGGFEFSSDAFLYIFLPALLFEAALAIDVRRLMDDLAPILLLAVVAVVICTVVAGLALSAVTDIGIVPCLLLGAIVATTDPAAVVGIFRDLGAPRRLTILVEGESLFNDAAAIALFTLLLAMALGQREADLLETAGDFLKEFAGGALLGYLAARGMCAIIGPLRGYRHAEITLTVSLAYLVFVIGDRYLHVSGVVAVVTAALVVSYYGRTRITPSTSDALVETWRQLGFWANSLIFLLAAMLVPAMVDRVSWQDAALLAVLIPATLVARAIVLYGLMPLLSGVGLAERVSGAYKLVVLWGGLRGAVSLALALAVTEHAGISPEVRHFVAVLTTGYVLFTLFVNGISLRPLLRLLHLDKLSRADRAVRDRAIALALTEIKDRVEAIARSDRVEPAIIEEVVGHFASRIAASKPEDDSAALSEEDLVYIGLATLATREEQIYMQRFRERIISRRIAQSLLAQGGRFSDGVKTGGREGYQRAAEMALTFPDSFRAALFLHQHFGMNHWLAGALADRFEMLLVSQHALTELCAFNRARIAPLLGAAAGRSLAAILEERLAAIELALSALRLQYPDHSRALQQQYLDRVAVRLEEEGYRGMLAESVISREVYNDLERRLLSSWQRLDQRPPLDIAMRRETLIARVPLFAGLAPDKLQQIAGMMRPRLAVPGERLIAAGERGDAMFFIASGAVEVKVASPVRLGSGDFFGEIALLAHRPRTADVVSLGFCSLLVLQLQDMNQLLDSDPALRQHIDAVARQRLAATAGG